MHIGSFYINKPRNCTCCHWLCTCLPILRTLSTRKQVVFNLKGEKLRLFSLSSLEYWELVYSYISLNIKNVFFPSSSEHWERLVLIRFVTLETRCSKSGWYNYTSHCSISLDYRLLRFGGSCSLCQGKWTLYTASSSTVPHLSETITPLDLSTLRRYEWVRKRASTHNTSFLRGELIQWNFVEFIRQPTSMQVLVGYLSLVDAKRQFSKKSNCHPIWFLSVYICVVLICL
jgi:hypothetical protein